MESFKFEKYNTNEIHFNINTVPVSVQNKSKKKKVFKKEIKKIVSKSEYIITSTVWIHIDYYCSHFKRFKNPGMYDIDNIIKPIIDALTGIDGILIDDIIIDRITVNWIDSENERIEITASYPDWLFMKKEELIFLKSKSNWCFPISRKIKEEIKKLLCMYINIWNSIQSENDYYKNVASIPIQNFIHYSKIKNNGFEFEELKCKNFE